MTSTTNSRILYWSCLSETITQEREMAEEKCLGEVVAPAPTEKDMSTIIEKIETIYPRIASRSTFSQAFCENNFLKAVSFSPDGSCVLTNSEDKILRVFDVSNITWQSQIESSSSLVFEEVDILLLLKYLFKEIHTFICAYIFRSCLFCK